MPRLAVEHWRASARRAWHAQGHEPPRRRHNDWPLFDSSGLTGRPAREGEMLHTFSFHVDDTRYSPS